MKNPAILLLFKSFNITMILLKYGIIIYKKNKKSLQLSIKGAIVIILIIVFSFYSYSIYIDSYYNDINKKELLRIKEQNESAYEVFSYFIEQIEKTDYKIQITSAYRSYEEQEYLHEINKKNALPGNSAHNSGLAIDINAHKLLFGCIVVKKYTKKTEKSEWEKTNIPTIGKTCSLKWGGDFNNYYDPVHFEITQ